MEIAELQVQDRVERDHWWYVARRRILDDLLATLGGSFRDACDVGAGAGSHLPVLRRHAARVTAIDVSLQALGYCRQKGYDEAVSASLEQPLPPAMIGRFDLVTAMDVLEHLDDDARGVAALAGLAAPGGRLVITVPAFGWLWGLQDDVSHHRRRYRLRALLDLVRAARLEVWRSTYFNTLLFPPILLARLAMRVRRPSGVRSENEINSPLINSLLTSVFLGEAALLRRGARFPVGVSALVVARKPEGR